LTDRDPGASALALSRNLSDLRLAKLLTEHRELDREVLFTAARETRTEMRLLDATLREGEQRSGRSFSVDQKVDCARMLDDLGVPQLLGVASAADLFGSSSYLLHTTSAVRYPTFLHGQNYTGSRPPLVRSAFLMPYVRDVLAPELSQLHGAVFVPLGKSVGAALELLETEQRIPAGRTLHGFPHPSGANGHRARQFEHMRPEMKRRLEVILGGGASVGAVQQQHAADGAARRR